MFSEFYVLFDLSFINFPGLFLSFSAVFKLERNMVCFDGSFMGTNDIYIFILFVFL